MEVKPGYKQTEVGVIPEDWEVTTLGLVCQVFGRIGFRGYTVKDIVTQGEGAIAINPSNIQGNRTDFAKCTYVSWRKYEESPEIKVNDGDVLLVKTGSTFGKTAIVQNLPEKATLNPQVVVLKRIRVNSRFLGYMMGFPTIQSQISTAVVGGALPTLSQNLVARFKLPLPPTKAEQEAIAETLRDADAFIESLEQLLAKKRQLKQGAMQELLAGKKRLPGFSGEWELRALGEIAAASKGSQLSSSLMSEHGRFAHLNGGVSPSGYTDKFNTLGDTIAISEGGNSCGYVQFMSEPYWCGGHCYSVIPNGVDNRFLYHALKGEEPSIMGLRVGSGLPNVQKTALLAFNLRCPKASEEQTAIAAILSDMDAEISALEEKLAKARSIKQGMMQELLTGRIRLVRPASNVVDLRVKTASTPARSKWHNWQINEAVVISVLAKHFGSERWPLGRKRYTKLSYLLHRHVERRAGGYLKKAAGPYNPATKYKGPEGIALKNCYVRLHSRDEFSGFVAAERIGEAESYFSKWYGEDVLVWLEQFRRKSNDELELLASVDMAMDDLRRGGKAVELATVKQVIQDHPEWGAKLDRAIFSDDNISLTIESCRHLFDSQESDG